MKKISHKVVKNAEHRGNDNEVARNFQMEIQVIRNVNKEKPRKYADNEKPELAQ